MVSSKLDEDALLTSSQVYSWPISTNEAIQWHCIRRQSEPKEAPGNMSRTGTFLVKRGCDCVFNNQFQGPLVELGGIMVREGDRCLLSSAMHTISCLRSRCLPSSKYWVKLCVFITSLKQPVPKAIIIQVN